MYGFFCEMNLFRRFGDPQKVPNFCDHAPYLGRIVMNNVKSDTGDTKRPEHLALMILPSDDRADLRDREFRHSFSRC